MNERIPYFELKGNPHIKSKIKIFKRQMKYVLEIQKQASSFGWNDVTMMAVTSNKDVFMSCVQEFIFFTFLPLFFLVFICVFDKITIIFFDICFR